MLVSTEKAPLVPTIMFAFVVVVSIDPAFNLSAENVVFVVEMSRLTVKLPLYVAISIAPDALIPLIEFTVSMISALEFIRLNEPMLLAANVPIALLIFVNV